MRPIITLGIATLICVGCSLPPAKPVTRAELMQSRIYQTYEIEESPEEILDALNSDGEVMLKSFRKIGRKRYPVWVKVLATSSGLDTGDYDR